MSAGGRPNGDRDAAYRAEFRALIAPVLTATPIPGPGEAPLIYCPKDGRPFQTLSGLRTHASYHHPELGSRDRSLLAAEARRAAGWTGVRP